MRRDGHGRGGGCAVARQGGMRWRGWAGGAEGRAKLANLSGRAGMEQMPRDGTRRTMTERYGAEERPCGDEKGAKGREGQKR